MALRAISQLHRGRFTWRWKHRRRTPAFVPPASSVPGGRTRVRAPAALCVNAAARHTTRGGGAATGYWMTSTRKSKISVFLIAIWMSSFCSVAPCCRTCCCETHMETQPEGRGERPERSRFVASSESATARSGRGIARRRWFHVRFAHTRLRSHRLSRGRRAAASVASRSHPLPARSRARRPVERSLPFRFAFAIYSS